MSLLDFSNILENMFCKAFKEATIDFQNFSFKNSSIKLFWSSMFSAWCSSENILNDFNIVEVENCMNFI